MSKGCRVAIDCSSLARQWTGVAHFTYRLTLSLQDIRPDWDFLLFNGIGWGRTLSAPPDRHPSIRFWREIPFAYRAWRQVQRSCFSLLPRPFRPDVFLVPNHLPPGPCHPIVPIIHDLSHMRLPESHPKGRLRWLSSLQDAATSAPEIIAVSDFTKTEITSLLGVSPDRISVATPGISPGFRPQDDAQLAPVLDRLGLQTGTYYLCLAAQEPRKNLSTLIAAHKALPTEFRRAHPLVLAGAAGWGSQRVGAHDSMIREIGYVAAPDLPALLGGAIALCYPSHYEGFGMPLIEAMACGTPVIASTALGLDTASGDAALRIPPQDVADWTSTMLVIANNPKRREECVQRGLSHASLFSWRETASIVARVLERVAARHSEQSGQTRS